MAFNCWTSAKTHAKFCPLAAMVGGAGNGAFNVVNGNTESWPNLWPQLADSFGCKVHEKMFLDGGDEYRDFEPSTIELPFSPPVEDFATEMGIEGGFQKSRIYHQIDTTTWSKRLEVIEAYKHFAGEV
jgi:hypothetical protein